MSATDRERLVWADAAKGACIALVVLWHVTRKDYLALPWDVGGPVVGAWGTCSELLLPVRMPLFFLISGLFAARQLDRPWRDVLTRRVTPLLYLFVLWTLVHTAVLRLTPGFDTAVAHSPVELLAGLTVAPGNLWYLLALAVYVALARATRSHLHLALAAAFVLASVAAILAPHLPGNAYGLLANLLFFLVGIRLRLSGRLPGRGVLLALAAGFLVLVALWQAGVVPDGLPGFRPALGLLGVAAGITAARPLAGLAWLSALGQRTLPVYVLHLPLVALVHLASERLVTPHVGGSLVLAAAYPLVVTVLVVAVCLLLHRLLPDALFSAPWSRSRHRLAA